MTLSIRSSRWIALGAVLSIAAGAGAQDWPQWRGPNRDGKTTGFRAPATWPAALTKKWDVTVGSGVSNPSLVGDRLYVIAREGEEEVLRCMNAATGAEIWKKSYASDPATGSGSGRGLFVGPRSTPTIANGRVVTLGVAGILSCFDATSGDLKWRKDELVGQQNVPSFFTSSSPIVVDGLCIAQLGPGAGGGRGRRGGGDAAPPPAPRGGLIAFDLATGDEKWRAPSASPAYASPVLMTIDGMKVAIAMSENNLVAVNVADGKVVWQLPHRQGNYNAVTPIVDGQTLIFAGPGSGLTAVKLSKEGDALEEQELWRYTENNLIFNTPVLKDGALYGLSTEDQLFCVNAEHGTGWTAPIVPAVAALFPTQPQTVFGQQAEAGGQREGGGEMRGQGEGRGQREGRGGPGRRGRGPGRVTGGGERAGYGSIVDAGSVLMALTPGGHFVVFQPKADSYTEVARYKVSEEGECYSHPIASGNRIYTKDRDSVTMWTVE
ncbi:MAG: PQQ-binding-like beta-propeller repeat protein [Pirellulales bacterium]